MSRCLTDRTLMLLQAGEGGAGARAHLRACPPCATRYRALEDDLGVVAGALRAGPPPAAERPRLRWRAVGEQQAAERQHPSVLGAVERVVVELAGRGWLHVLPFRPHPS